MPSDIPVPVDLSPWRAGRVVCIDGRAWLEISRCELVDRVYFPSTRDRKFATVDAPQLDVSMWRLTWMRADNAPSEVLQLASADLVGGVSAPLVIAGQAWHLMDRDWQCSMRAGDPRTDVVDTLSQLTLRMVRAWWADPVNTKNGPHPPSR